jgi:hypothetical protein
LALLKAVEPLGSVTPVFSVIISAILHIHFSRIQCINESLACNSPIWPLTTRNRPMDPHNVTSLNGYCYLIAQFWTIEFVPVTLSIKWSGLIGWQSQQVPNQSIHPVLEIVRGQHAQLAGSHTFCHSTTPAEQ